MCVCVCVCERVYIYTYTHTNCHPAVLSLEFNKRWTRVCVCVCVCVSVCVYIYTRTHTHTYTHTHTQKEHKPKATERHKHAFAFLLLASALFFSGRRLNSIRTEKSSRVCNRDHLICSMKRYQRRFTVAWTSFNPSVNSPSPTASFHWVTTPRCELSSHVVNRDLAGFMLSSRTKINKKTVAKHAV